MDTDDHWESCGVGRAVRGPPSHAAVGLTSFDPPYSSSGRLPHPRPLSRAERGEIRGEPEFGYVQLLDDPADRRFHPTREKLRINADPDDQSEDRRQRENLATIEI